MFRLISIIVLISAVVLPCHLKADVNCVADAAGCCCRGTRGNVDCDFQDIVDISDLTLLIDYLYISFQPLPSYDEANVDAEDGIDMSDLAALIDGLYISRLPFPNCPGPVNHPPVTLLVNLDSSARPFINTVDDSKPGSGVPFRWTGSDRLDHPYIPPVLKYEWRTYGPYDSATYAGLVSEAVRQVFVTPFGVVYHVGDGDRIPVCDTTFIPGPPPSRIILCDTLLIDTVTTSNRFGRLDTIFAFTSPQFVSNPSYNRLVDWSGTPSDHNVVDTAVTLYNLFRDDPSDTTVEKYFVFVVRTRDADDTTLYDPTPPFHPFMMFDPKFERDIFLVDAEIDYSVNSRLADSGWAYWNSAVSRWNPAATIDTNKVAQPYGNVLTLKSLLQHKVAIIFSDDVIPGVTFTIRSAISQAMRAGVGIWLCGRNMFFGGEGEPPQLHVPSRLFGGSTFGISEGHWSGWQYYLNDSMRIEDFCGAISFDSTTWPNLNVDTSFLHSRYLWDPDIAPWLPTLAALPEVNYFTPVPQAEVLYTYKSIYTNHHPIVPDSFFYAGQPVVFRLSNDSTRVFASCFTPYSFDNAAPDCPIQAFVDSALNWLMSRAPSTRVRTIGRERK